MISSEENPVEWALLSYELEEVTEHLQELSNKINLATSISEEEFSVAIGHIYAHLNRIWNSRNHKGEITQELFEKFSQPPCDMELYG